ncbi:MAG TPA: hypothetical protein VIY29_29430 [Ktedonobacteraceae bacterium]
MSRCFCPACSAIFTCVSAFDMHRVGSFGEPIYAVSRSGKSHQVVGHTAHERHCLTASEMLTKSMVANVKGWWMTRPSEETHWAENAHPAELVADR